MATRHLARYAVTYGLSGCYMPDSHLGAVEFATRREFTAFIRDELKFYEMPARLFRDVNMRNLWRRIARHGSSSAHFSLRHGAYELAFHGLTESEYAQQSAEES